VQKSYGTLKTRQNQKLKCQLKHYLPQRVEIDWLEQRLTANEAAYADLHKQMLASAELIKALAEQNAQLINAIELQRKRIIRLTVFTIIIGIISAYLIMNKF
jgi:hypothetical protein